MTFPIIKQDSYALLDSKVGDLPTTCGKTSYTVTALESRIDLLFVSPLQSVDPGQQFTWEHSNLEVNKAKNRYANVIAYDHSRVLLSSIDGTSGPGAF